MRLGIQVGASLVRGGYLSLGEALALLHSTPFRGVEVNQAHLTAFGDVEGFARRLSMFSLSLAGVYWGAKFHLMPGSGDVNGYLQSNPLLTL